MKISKFLVASAFTVLLSACASHGDSLSTGEYIDDAATTAKVKAALLGAKNAPVLGVHIDTHRGNVQLSGFVNSTKDKERVAEIASKQSGVNKVTNGLMIKRG